MRILLIVHTLLCLLSAAAQLKQMALIGKGDIKANLPSFELVGVAMLLNVVLVAAGIVVIGLNL